MPRQDHPPQGPKRQPVRSDPARAPGPNSLRNGRVVRTLWAGETGTLRWRATYGEQLLCVRYREDPAGLRRLVTVELVMGPVAQRPGQRRLRDRAWYPLWLDTADPRDAAIIRRLRHHGGRRDREGHWYLTGALIRAWGLIERIAMRPGTGRSLP